MSERRPAQYSEAGYRKGAVMGLTLAEIALLLVFILLLLLAAGFSSRDRKLSAFRGAVPVAQGAYKKLISDASTLEAVRQVLGAAPKLTNDDFMTLVKARLQSSDTEIIRKLSDDSATLQDIRQSMGEAGLIPNDAFAALVKAKIQIAGSLSDPALKPDLDRLLAQKKRVEERLAALEKLAAGPDGAKKLDDALAANVDLVENQQGQIRQLQDQLASAGAGRVLPSCWTTANGKVEYLFDVALTSTGLRVAERPNPGRIEQRSRLPISQMSASRLLKPSEFTSLTQPLFALSKANNCRYYVVVYDATSASEKDLYKTLLDTVEDHFYKLKVSQAFPGTSVLAPAVEGGRVSTEAEVEASPPPDQNETPQEQPATQTQPELEEPA